MQCNYPATGAEFEDNIFRVWVDIIKEQKAICLGFVNMRENINFWIHLLSLPIFVELPFFYRLLDDASIHFSFGGWESPNAVVAQCLQSVRVSF